MELLVATLAQIVAGRETDGLIHVRLTLETTRSAHGLVSARFYRSRGNEAYYFMLTTWEDEEAWQKAQERYSPKQLLLDSAASLLTDTPEQWLMHYLWGYSRPGAFPLLAAAHLGTIQPDQAEQAQRVWMESLRRQAVQPMLSFAFLARGLEQGTSSAPPQSTLAKSRRKALGSLENPPQQSGSIFLNLLSWASETDREEFYADPDYKAIKRFLSTIGIVQVLALEPM